MRSPRSKRTAISRPSSSTTSSTPSIRKAPRRTCRRWTSCSAALASLKEATGVIAAAQTIAARAFGSRRTFLATNGTSTSNKVIFQTLPAPGEKLLLDRNCHKSVHHGVVLSGGHPIYLASSINAKYSLYAPVPKKTILSPIPTHPATHTLILPSCTYDGLRYDLAPIVEAEIGRAHV